MQTYVVTANRNRDVEKLLTFEDGTETVQFDFSPWSDDNGSVTAVTWTVRSGQASVGNTALASNVASATITTADQGTSLIQVKATAGNNVYVAHLHVKAKDPEYPSQDYGLCHGG